MSDEFDPVEAIREAAQLLEWTDAFHGFAHNHERKVAAMLQGADQLEALRAAGDAVYVNATRGPADWLVDGELMERLFVALGAGE